MESLEAAVAAFGTLTLRVDLQNLPAPLRKAWPGDGYAMLNGGYGVEHEETVRHNSRRRRHRPCDRSRRQAFVLGGLPEQGTAAEIVRTGRCGVHRRIDFRTGPRRSRGTAIPKDHPLRGLYIHEGANGALQSALNMTVLHGVKSSLALAQTGDATHARTLSNPDVSPNLAFADFGGHGYATVRA